MFFTSFPEMETQEHASKKLKHSLHEDDSKIVPFLGGGGGGDGSSIEVAKRPRGRPAGSKNKPKPTVIISRMTEPSSSMRPHVLEISAGHDIIASLSGFSRRRNLGVCVLAGSGAVYNVSLRQPPHPTADSAAVTSPGTVGFRGRFEILSISATFFPPGMGVGFTGAVTISLAGPGGQVLGGTAVGPVVAAGKVTVVAAAFEDPEFHRLPPVEEASAAADLSVSGGSSRERGESEEGYRHHPGYDHLHQQQRENDDHNMAMPTSYGSHFPAEVMWNRRFEGLTE